MKRSTLITGASSGIGRALAQEAAADGHALVLVARDPTRLEATAAELPTACQVIALDLAKPGAAERLSRELKQRRITVETLINNAGIGDYGAFIRSDETRTARLLQLNITSLVELTRALLPQIIKAKGSILNVSSVAGFMPGPNMSAYFASKAFVLSFSEGLHEELRYHGVGVTCLCPGPTATDFGKKARVDERHSTATTGVTPEQVARYGWKALKKNRAVAIYGPYNQIMVQVAVRLLPRWLLRRLVHRMQP